MERGEWVAESQLRSVQPSLLRNQGQKGPSPSHPLLYLLEGDKGEEDKRALDPTSWPKAAATP